MKKQEIKKLYYNILKKEIEEYNSEIDYFFNKYDMDNLKLKKFILIRRKIEILEFLEDKIFENKNYFFIYGSFYHILNSNINTFNEVINNDYENFISISKLNKYFFEVMFLKNEKLIQKEVLEIEIKNKDSLNNKNKKIVKV